MPLPIIAGAGAIVSAFFSNVVGWVWAFITFALPFILTKLFVFLGLSFVAYQGLDLAFGALESWVFGKFDSVATDMFAIMVLAEVDWAIKVIFTAMSVVLVLRMSIKGAGLARSGSVS